MIEGLKLDVPGQDIIAHINTRVQYHRDKQARYTEQADSLKELERDGNTSVHSSMDAQRDLRSKSDSHAASADYFAFAAKYLNAAETYRLEQGDLPTLEYTSRNW